MAEKKKNQAAESGAEQAAEQEAQTAAPEAGQTAEQETQAAAPEAEQTAEQETQAAAPEAEQARQPARQTPEEAQAAADDRFLRLAAEYDNYRKRTAREKDLAWTEARAQTVAAFLPVYDNLERALKQPCADEAYARGVELTMKGLQDALTGLGVEQIPALGERFDPNRHNAVMHVDDENADENTIVEVFQQGFTCGEKVIRFAMVKVAN